MHKNALEMKIEREDFEQGQNCLIDGKADRLDCQKKGTDTKILNVIFI